MICAAILAHNSAATIRHAIRSVSWCDGIFLFDDHSSDGTADIAEAVSIPPIRTERSPFHQLAFAEGELRVRNYMLDRLERTVGAEAIVLLDADEIMDRTLLPYAREVQHGSYSSVSTSIFHLFDPCRYIRYRETLKYGLYQIDPHVRVIREGMRYTELRSGDEGHPLMSPGSQPLHLHGSFHFHLKYLRSIGLENSSLEFLPRNLTEVLLADFLEPIPFRLPTSVSSALQALGCSLDHEGELRQLPMSYAVSGQGRQSYLVVTVGAPYESLILSRLMELLRLRKWAGEVSVLCSQSACHLSSSADMWTFDRAVCAGRSDVSFDYIFQLSATRSVVAAASAIRATIRRGLILSPHEEIRPANVLALGYFGALQENPNPDRLIALAAQACELE
jgi:glycosyltransferase involved in cell wall biosynthesis